MKLVQHAIDRFELITSEGSSVLGNLQFITDHMIHNVGFDESQIDKALEDFGQRGTNTAYFGMGGLFLFSGKRNLVSSLVTELDAIEELGERFESEFLRNRESLETFDAYMALQSARSSPNYGHIKRILMSLEPEARKASWRRSA